MALTQQQLVELAEHSAAGDRIAYYSLLAESGDQYAALALSVVLEQVVGHAIQDSQVDGFVSP